MCAYGSLDFGDGGLQGIEVRSRRVAGGQKRESEKMFQD
jgi:hypothetical protein